MAENTGIGALVKGLRSKRAWPQWQLADVAGVTMRTIQRLESSNIASFETLKSVASALEIDVGLLQSVDVDRTQLNNSDYDFLERIKSGESLFRLGGGADTYIFQHDEPHTQEESELIGDFVQSVKDFGDVWRDLEPKDRVKFSFSISESIKNLEATGYFIFAGLKKRPFAIRKASIELTMFTINILNSTNPRIIKLEGVEVLPVRYQATYSF